MIYIQQNVCNEVPVVVERNTTITGTTFYLWNMVHKLSNETFVFVPYKIPPSTDYKPGYDLFCICYNNNIPQSLTGNTGCISGNTGQTVCNVHFIPGEYSVEIWKQSNNYNLDVNQAEELVYQTLGQVIGVNQNIPEVYSGTSDVFIIYNENNN